MRNTFTRKELALAVSCALALGVFSETALAQARDINEHALVVDSSGAPVMSGFGLCVPWECATRPSSIDLQHGSITAWQISTIPSTTALSP
jgi:hypothetical protein